MFRKTSILFSIFALMLCSITFQVGCSGGDQCKINTDCEKGHECKNKNGVKSCFKKNTNTTDCNPACFNDEKCENGKCVAKGSGCNPACGADEKCENNQCVKKAQGCNPACANDEKCENGQCVKQSQGCNPACKANEKCENNKCVPNATGCNPACKPDEECKGTTCVPKAQCTENGDCPTGQECKGGKCVAQGGCNPACQANQECKNGQCVDKPQCTQNSDCQANQECKAGKCVPKSGCTNNSECASGEECKAGKCVPKSGCNPACKANEECKNNQCVPKPQCTQNSDCPSGQECKANKCVPKPQCTSNADCPSGHVCQAGKCVKVSGCNPPCGSGQKCVNGQCVNSNTCNPPCGSGQKCVSGKCVNTGCTRNSDCPSGQICSSGKCIPGGTGSGNAGDKCDANKPCKTGNTCIRVNQTDAYCFQNCTSNSTCASNPVRKSCEKITSSASFCVKLAKENESCGFVGKNQAVCDTGLNCDTATSKCKKPTPVGLYSKCGTGSNCQNSNHICLTLETGSQHGYCLSKCDPKKPNCAGGARCAELTGGGGACLYAGTAGLNAVCKDIDLKASKLNVHEQCKSEFDCVSGKCIKPTIVATGTKCEDGKRCNEKTDLCLRFTSGAAHGYCVKKCDPKSPSCLPGQTCEALTSGGYCQSPGTGDNDDECGKHTGAKLDPKQICKKGLDCVNFGRSICTQLWTGNCKTPGKKCLNNRTCLDLTAGSTSYGGCFSACVSGKCAKTHLECRTTSSNTCWPKPPTGTVKLGGVCRSSGSANQLCTSGLRCLMVQQGATTGFCSKSCTSNSDCPSVTTSGGKTVKGTCHTQSSNCIFTCTSSSSPCPDGLKCIASQICGP